MRKRENTSNNLQATILPVLPLRDMVLFPGVVTALNIGRLKSRLAIEHAMANGRYILLLPQYDAEVEDPAAADLFEVGILAECLQQMRMPDDSLRITLETLARFKVGHFQQFAPYLSVEGMPIIEKDINNNNATAAMRSILRLFARATQLSDRIPDEALERARALQQPGQLADLIAGLITLTNAQKQMVLDTFPPLGRLKLVADFLNEELMILELERQIHSKVKTEMEEDQREYYLRERMKVIQEELGETEEHSTEMAELRDQIINSGMPPLVLEKAMKEVDRLERMPTISPEVSVVRTYVDWLLCMPWQLRSEEVFDLHESEKILNEDHWGLLKVKERILEFLAVRRLNPKMKGPILCFVGPPGVGKTSIGRSIARSLEREFVRISLGGVRDEGEIRGHRRTYIGALPGRIVQGMKTAGKKNPVFMMDEVDKIGQDFRGDPSAALLEVLDPEQNYAFSDHYLEVPLDLSEVMFITTANQLDPIPEALRDRMEIIEFPGYTEDDKQHIAENFLEPKQRKEHGLTKKNLRIAGSALQEIIRRYTREAGVRQLEREIAAVCRKVARKVASGELKSCTVTDKNINEFLGAPRYQYGMAESQDEVGVATGMGWTAVGGDTLAIEVSLMKGKGILQLTGQLGDVMQESAKAAMSYTRAHADDLGLQDIDFAAMDVHIHVPAGQTPKDGPSAGITLATALISAFTGRPVRRTVAMTGEITLRGHVLPVGGLKEKILAAHRAGITDIILPADNRKDLEDFPAHVAAELTFHYVKKMPEVLAVALAE